MLTWNLFQIAPLNINMNMSRKQSRSFIQTTWSLLISGHPTFIAVRWISDLSLEVCRTKSIDVPPPIPVVSYWPSIDSLPATKDNDTVLFSRSVDSKKSDGSRKPAESQVHSAVRWSCQELLASHPSPIYLELLDQAIRDSIRWTSETSRILTPANFRHSIISRASVWSRLSVRLSLSWNKKLIAH